MPFTPNQPRPGSGHPGREKPRGPRQQDERKSELVCRVKYCNTLPDIPFDPKFLSYPFESTRFVSYKPTSLERSYKYDLLTEHDLGITVDLVLPDTYQVANDEEVILDPKDEKLLEEDFGSQTDRKRSERHSRIISWMRRPDYISTEQTRYQPTTIEKVEANIGYTIRKKMNVDEELYMDRESQIEAIEKTFKDAEIPINNHYSKPHVHPVEVLPIMPDYDMWKYPCAQVIFDSDPAPGGVPQAQQMEQMGQAMIRGGKFTGPLSASMFTIDFYCYFQ